MTEADREEREKLEIEIESLEIFNDKFGSFLQELELKVDYATAEVEGLTE